MLRVAELCDAAVHQVASLAVCPLFGGSLTHIRSLQPCLTLQLLEDCDHETNARQDQLPKTHHFQQGGRHAADAAICCKATDPDFACKTNGKGSAINSITCCWPVQTHMHRPCSNGGARMARHCCMHNFSQLGSPQQL